MWGCTVNDHVQPKSILLVAHALLMLKRTKDDLHVAHTAAVEAGIRSDAARRAYDIARLEHERLMREYLDAN